MQRYPIFRAGLLFHVALKQVYCFGFDEFFHRCPEWQLHSGSGSGSGFGSGSSGSGSWFAQYILTIVIFNM